jgi:N-acetylglucosaminyl-diphospho-decaprenol L-rhamnosyltransferase
LVTLSVVSHGQNELVKHLVDDLDRYCETALELVLTENVPGVETLSHHCTHPREVIPNSHPKGFGANHNAAFTRCRTPYFCVINPDVRLHADPFPGLIAILADRRVGVVGPLIRNPKGGVEDSARRFPTLPRLFRKLIRDTARPDYPWWEGPMRVDWIGGMFMVFRSETYALLKGFDERYYLYYEDVDICQRLHRLGFDVVYNPGVEVSHDAQRGSRRDAGLALHHATSMVRYLTSRTRSS